MNILLIGLVVFIAIHLLPTSIKLRSTVIDNLGYVPYLAAFSVISIVGFVLIIYGYSQAPIQALYQPFAAAQNIAQLLMPLAFILLLSAYLNTHFRDWLKHPMLIGTALWALAHLLANGEKAAVLLFGGFFIYSLVDILLAKPRQQLIPKGKSSIVHDAIAVVGGLAAYALVMHYHQSLFGVGLIGS